MSHTCSRVKTAPIVMPPIANVRSNAKARIFIFVRSIP